MQEKNLTNHLTFLEKLQLLLPQYTILRITKSNYNRYLDVFYSNAEYYNLTDGRPAIESDCLDTINYCPKNFDTNKVYLVGFSQNDIAISVLSCLEDYPKTAILYIGLLLVDKTSQSKGVGSELVQAIIEASKGSFDLIQLSVQGNNKAALSFWEKMGFIFDRSNVEKADNIPMRKML